MNKKDALAILFKCADEYRNNLENRNLLLIFGDRKKAHSFETTFFQRNYLHLTGVIPDQDKFKSATEFYKACIDKRLTVDDFEFVSANLTEMKLSVLMQMMNIHKSAKMVGDYNFNKSQLYTERLAGGIFGCMGFIRENEFYVPNTVIKEDLRDVTLKPQHRVLAIMRKKIASLEYKEVTYIAKGIKLEELGLSQIGQCSKSTEKQDTNRKSLDEQLYKAKELYEKNVPERVNKDIKKAEQVR